MAKLATLISMPTHPQKVFLGIPFSGGSTRWETSMSLLSLISQPSGFEFIVFPGGGCDIAHARNLMIHECLEHSGKGCSKILMIDSDIRFTPDQITRILSWDYPVVGGIYPRKKMDELAWSVNGNVEKMENGLWSVDELCTGFMCIRTDLLREMQQAYPETAYTIEDSAYAGETGHELFAMGVVDGRRLSEDYYFSKRVRDLGYPVIADPFVQLGHIGDVDYLRLHASRN